MAYSFQLEQKGYSLDADLKKQVSMAKAFKTKCKRLEKFLAEDDDKATISYYENSGLKRYKPTAKLYMSKVDHIRRRHYVWTHFLEIFKTDPDNWPNILNNWDEKLFYGFKPALEYEEYIQKLKKHSFNRKVIGAGACKSTFFKSGLEVSDGAHCNQTHTISKVSNPDRKKSHLVKPFSQNVNIHVLTGHNYDITKVSFSHDNRLLASSDSLGSIIIWNCVHERKLHSFEDDIKNYNRAISFSPDGKILAISRKDKTINFWDLQTDRHYQVFKHKRPVCALTFSNDGNLLVIGDDRGKIVLLNLTKSKVKTLTGLFEKHKSKIEGLNFSKDNSFLVSGSYDGEIKLWDMTNYTIFETSAFLKGNNDLILFNPKCSAFAYHSWSYILLWNYIEDKEITYFTRKYGYMLDFAPDGEHIICLLNPYPKSKFINPEISIIDISTKEKVGELTINGDYYFCSSSPDKKFMAFSEPEGKIKIVSFC